MYVYVYVTRVVPSCVLRFVLSDDICYGMSRRNKKADGSGGERLINLASNALPFPSLQLNRLVYQHASNPDSAPAPTLLTLYKPNVLALRSVLLQAKCSCTLRSRSPSRANVLVRFARARYH